MKRTSARAIIIHKDKVLLIHRIKNGREYFIFPGGGIEPGETIKDATIREVKEETSCEVAYLSTPYRVIFDNDTDNYFSVCEYISGVPKLSDGTNEVEDLKKLEGSLFVPEWHDISHVSKLQVLPIEISDWLLEDIRVGFKNKREARLKMP
jgi:ADP-ribose pyrophosphatase YjhB (NUDIX family)